MGIGLGQIVLYGPSLAGRVILLPIDILATPQVYLPETPEHAGIVTHDPVLSDLTYQFEIERRFAASEIRAGRFPAWAPYQYAGVPFVWPKFSPLLLFAALTTSPVILAWTTLVAAMLAGVGAYLFCRRVLEVGFWPAAIAAWCYPLTGFFVLWQGSPVITSAYWLPWAMLAVDAVVRRPCARRTAGLGLVTGLVLVSGHLDVAGQVLLASAAWAALSSWDAYRLGSWREAAKGAGAVIAGWCLGVLLAAPHVLPLIEYAETGSRIQSRHMGNEERPPVGLSALPEVVLPDIYGSTAHGSFPNFPERQGNLLEGAAGAYAGIFAALLFAPLACLSRRRWRLNASLAFLGFFGLSWSLAVPGFVQLLRLPILGMMSHNRLVFVTAFAILTLGAVGLHALLEDRTQPRWWFWLPATMLALLGGWSAFRALRLPEPMATRLEAAVRQGSGFYVSGLQSVREVQAWFRMHYTASAVLCGLGVVGWIAVPALKSSRPALLAVATTLLLGDLLWFAHGRSPQCDPALYFPPIPALQAIAHAPPGRVVGYGCLPAPLAQTNGLSDIRGYDAVDPARLMELMEIGADPRSPAYPYARTQWYIPRISVAPPDVIRLPAILDMLDVRYVIFRGTPPSSIHPRFQSPDYWVLENRAALPRCFVPRRVESVAGEKACLEKLRAPRFDPREIAYVETPVDLPAESEGAARIVSETPTRVVVHVEMKTAGLVVLSDLWDTGWHAYLDGTRVPILRTNHAIRGVVVSPATTRLEFRYEPASFRIGLALAAAASAILALAAFRSPIMTKTGTPPT